MPHGLLILIIGLLIGGIGCVALVARRGESRAIARIRRTPTTRVFDAPAEGLLEICGQVVVGEQGTVCSPLTAREGVVLSIAVDEWLSGHSTSRRPYLRETLRLPFYVDDGSGELARVDPNEAIFISQASELGDDYLAPLRYGKPTRSTVTAEMRTWVASRSTRPVPNVICIEEEMIAPGERVYVLGWAQRRPGPAGAMQLTLSHQGDGEGELLVSNLSEADLLGEVGKRRRKIWILLVLGVSCCAASIAMAVLGQGW